MGKQDVEKHKHNWKLCITDTKSWNTEALPGQDDVIHNYGVHGACECGSRLQSDEIVKLLNTFYK